MSPLPPLTTRLLMALSQEQQELQQENAENAAALESLVDTQSTCIQAQSDEIAFLKTQLEQLKHEATSSREALQAEMRFRLEQQATIAELRSKNSQLTRNDQALKELIAIFKVLDEGKASDWPQNNLKFEGQELLDSDDLAWHRSQIQQNMQANWERNQSHIPTPAHWTPLLRIIQKAAKEATP